MLQPPHQSLQVAAVPAQRVPERDRDQDAPWHTEAVCRRDEAGLFFAPSKEPTAARLSREEAAKRVCGRCPVMVECREHALLQPEPYGVWGGQTAPDAVRLGLQQGMLPALDHHRKIGRASCRERV